MSTAPGIMMRLEELRALHSCQQKVFDMHNTAAIRSLLDSGMIRIPPDHTIDALMYGMSYGQSKAVTFKGHPFIQWLSKWLLFDPDVHMVVRVTMRDVYGHPEGEGAS